MIIPFRDLPDPRTMVFTLVCVSCVMQIICFLSCEKTDWWRWFWLLNVALSVVCIFRILTHW